MSFGADIAAGVAEDVGGRMVGVAAAVAIVVLVAAYGAWRMTQVTPAFECIVVEAQADGTYQKWFGYGLDECQALDEAFGRRDGLR